MVESIGAFLCRVDGTKKSWKLQTYIPPFSYHKQRQSTEEYGALALQPNLLPGGLGEDIF
ncbi:MAG: hypothetical protein NT070_05000 [Cyanobacteria bacterium]|nr:hypothetical protein [Cyanobacteriota bacterium]